ncbi:hypothetical protein NLG97_g11282 [Lecanicillium saksenae]|uniref:Uncharacterized protein n=1 Tax=Lecanicillium saksenae TaxID=468837 RepID=A0ACC1QAZ6_9HYPO|nr:hypothetical protein NLG97_g11282 [Lecanicillium saksenae]
MTRTVGGGHDNIEIIIININTGESICQKKDSGKPCRHQAPGAQPDQPLPFRYQHDEHGHGFQHGPRHRQLAQHHEHRRSEHAQR